MINKIQHSFNGPDRDRRLFVILFTPSGLSSLLTIVTALGTVIGVIVAAHNKSNGGTWLQFLHHQSAQTSANYQSVTSSLQNNRVIADLPLLLLWGLVGLVVYFFASNLVNAVRSVAQLAYINVNRRQLVLMAAQHLLIRAVVLALWVPYILIFFHRLVPYCIANALTASTQLPAMQGFVTAGLTTGIILVTLHTHTILLRAFFLRPRLFSGGLYLS